MTDKHTPGPWTVEFFNRTLNGLPWHSKFQPVDVVIGNRRLRVSDTPEGDADARLIAAAPDLLEVAHLVLDTATIETPAGLVEAARAAIEAMCDAALEEKK